MIQRRGTCRAAATSSTVAISSRSGSVRCPSAVGGSVSNAPLGSSSTARDDGNRQIKGTDAFSSLLRKTRAVRSLGTPVSPGSTANSTNTGTAYSPPTPDLRGTRGTYIRMVDSPEPFSSREPPHTRVFRSTLQRMPKLKTGWRSEVNSNSRYRSPGRPSQPTCVQCRLESLSLLSRLTQGGGRSHSTV
jgi:hypothetical protein